MTKTEQFIKRAISIHGDRYDYSKSEYVNARTRLIVICKEHGEFLVTPDSHLNRKSNCGKCSDRERLTTEEFVRRARSLHGDKYDYTNTVYLNNAHTKVSVICPRHGEFLVRPANHLKTLRPRGCPECGKESGARLNTKTQGEFIADAIKKHGMRYSYSKVVYKSSKEKVVVTCMEHGDFEISPSLHIVAEYGGCPVCWRILQGMGRRSDTIEFVQKAIAVHGDKYDYSKVNYQKAIVPVKIICKEHGEFLQTPDAHLSGKGCRDCNTKGGGFSTKKDAVLYVYNHPTFVGFGISNNFEQRNRNHQKTFSEAGFSLEVDKLYPCSGEMALHAESSVLAAFKDFKLNTGLDGFKREALVPEAYPMLIKYLDDLLK